MLSLLACLVAVQPAQALPTVTVEADDTRITESCRVVIPKGLVLRDANNNGVIHIAADDITIEFVEGECELLGTEADAEFEKMTGIGIRIEGRRNVTLKTPHPHRYKIGIWATDADGLRILGGDFSNGYAMKLGSTPQREDGADWLWPHANDNGEWRDRYGAAICVERSKGIEISGIYCRSRQNAILLDRVTDSKIFDNDCSFLSGWGLAMWRSSGNVVAHNAFDFCIRGYSHGVYNRGQDSAGILMFEQCNNNVIAGNSVTHGGDGVFGFGGKEALGDGPVPDGFDHTRKGCNDNLFLRNDLNYAAAHGLEMTFSFGNGIWENEFLGNAICGIWGGYSQETLIVSNRFVGNGEAGYGLERGGVNIEHGAGNRITANMFEDDAVALHLWTDADEGIRKLPWAKANYKGSHDNVFGHNSATNVPIAVRLRGENTDLRMNLNLYEGVEREVEGDWQRDPRARPQFPAPLEFDFESLPGTKRPRGERAEFAGREHIIMGEYFPWDFKQPMLRLARTSNAEHVYELFGVNDERSVSFVVQGENVASHTLTRVPKGSAVHQPAVIRIGAKPGVCAYDLEVRTIDAKGQPVTFRRSGNILAAEWQVKVFAWQTDPRQDPAGWQAEAAAAPTAWQTLPALDLEYGSRGPAHFGLKPDVGNDRFGTLARTTMPLPAGKWLFRVRSDDGVRVKADGRVVVENWTWHAPREDRGVLELDEAREVEIEVEHFELDGYAALRLEIEPVKE